VWLFSISAVQRIVRNVNGKASERATRARISMIRVAHARPGCCGDTAMYSRQRGMRADVIDEHEIWRASHGSGHLLPVMERPQRPLHSVGRIEQSCVSAEPDSLPYERVINVAYPFRNDLSSLFLARTLFAVCLLSVSRMTVIRVRRWRCVPWLPLL